MKVWRAREDYGDLKYYYDYTSPTEYTSMTTLRCTPQHSINLPTGKVWCADCDGYGVIRCSGSCRQGVMGQSASHYHICKCCGGDGIHSKDSDTPLDAVRKIR